MLHGGKLTDIAFKEVESVLHNPGFFRHDFKPLFFVDPVPERAGAGNNGSVGNLAVKNNGKTVENAGFLSRKTGLYGVLTFLRIVYIYLRKIDIEYILA